MDNGYIKFKKKVLKEFLFKVLMITLSISIIIPSILLIIIKLKKIDFAFYYYILIGLGIFLLLTLLLYFIFKPNDIAIAIKLDKKLNMNQKVETMIICKNETGLIVEAQREDTNNKLLNKNIKEYKMKFKFWYFIALALCFIVLMCGILIPKDDTSKIVNNNPNNTINDYQVDELTLLKIDELIDYVNSSNILETYKKMYCDELETLKNNLIQAKTTIEKDSYARRCVNNIGYILDNTNSNLKLYAILKKSSDKTISRLGISLKTLDVDIVTNALKEVRLSLNVLSSEYSNALKQINNDFGKLIIDSGISRNELLTSVLIKLSSDLNELSDNTPTSSKIDVIFSNAIPTISTIITDQKNNFDVENYVETNLCELFDIPFDVENDDSNEDIETDKDDDSSQGNNSGGAGSGDTLYAGNDLMFDYEQGSVKYGDVIDEYYAKILEMFNEGLISEEYKDAFISYYEALYKKSEE